MKEANRSLAESGKAFAPVLIAKKQSGDVNPAIDWVERGIRAVNAAPQVDSQADQYRKRLFDLLTEQKNILDQYAQASSKNLSALANEEDALIDHYNQFASDYGKWLPGFLKEHGYELGGGPNR